MDTIKIEELTKRIEALEENSERQLGAIENAVALLGDVMDLQKRVLGWAEGKGFKRNDEGKGA